MAMQPIDPSSAPIPIDAGDFDGDDGRAAATPPGGLDGLIDLARSRLIAMVEDARDALVGQVRGLKDLVDLITEHLPEGAQPVAQFVGQAGSSIDGIADALAEKSVEELVEDGRALVQAQPAAAVAVAIALGFLAGRLLKAARD
ncbi:MAG: hypothetical protein KGQ52_09585 [Alphaproteobacteria bacterium]|nr:hypothetical protein [Alphaproteobacteria bacterium]